MEYDFDKKYMFCGFEPAGASRIYFQAPKTSAGNVLVVQSVIKGGINIKLVKKLKLILWLEEQNYSPAKFAVSQPKIYQS